MGLDLIYRHGADKLVLRLPQADWETLLNLREIVPEAVDLVMKVPEPGVGAKVKVDELLEAVEEIDKRLEEHQDMFSYVYQVKSVFGSSSAGMSGIRLPGDEEHYYWIRAGLNECNLVKMAAGNCDRATIVDEQDIRQLKELETANVGTIKIHKRRAASRLRDELKVIKKFLDSVDGVDIEKIMSV